MIALLLNRYVFGLVASVALMAGIYFAWERFVADPYREQGREAMLPTLAKAKAQLDRDVEAFAKVTAALELLKADSERLKRLAAQAQKVKILRQEVEKTRVEYVERLVPTGATECERTADVISKALR